MQFHMMGVTKGNGELVAGLFGHCPWLSKGQVMGLRRLAAMQARLAPDMAQVLIRPEPERLWV